MSAPLIPSGAEAISLIAAAEKIREAFKAMKMPRSESLCAALVLIGNEAGLENAHSREAFLAYAEGVIGWAYDLGVKARATGDARRLRERSH